MMESTVKRKNNSLWASKMANSGRTDQSLATRVEVGFLGSLGTMEVSTLLLLNLLAGTIESDAANQDLTRGTN